MKSYKMEVKAVYKYDDLTEDQKDMVIGKWLEHGIEDDWYDSTYEDAEQIGLKITSFDIGRGNYCDGKFIDSAIDCAEAIVDNHGEQCETYKTAKAFLDTITPMIEFRDNFVDDTQEAYNKWEENTDRMDDLENEFLKSILEDYRIILQHEWEYQASREYIEDMIRANDYDFDENGNIA